MTQHFSFINKKPAGKLPTTTAGPFKERRLYYSIGEKVKSMYNYLEAVKRDVKRYLEEEAPEIDRGDLFYGRYEFENKLNDELWVNDSVTGNASGSYTFNTYKAEENLCHNLDELEEACSCFGCDLGETIKKGAEHCDVTIRCYLLGRAISEVLDELEEEFEQEEEEE